MTFRRKYMFAVLLPPILTAAIFSWGRCSAEGIEVRKTPLKAAPAKKVQPSQPANLKPVAPAKVLPAKIKVRPVIDMVTPLGCFVPRGTKGWKTNLTGSGFGSEGKPYKLIVRSPSGKNVEVKGGNLASWSTERIEFFVPKNPAIPYGTSAEVCLIMENGCAAGIDLTICTAEGTMPGGPPSAPSGMRLKSASSPAVKKGSLLREEITRPAGGGTAVLPGQDSSSPGARLLRPPGGGTPASDPAPPPGGDPAFGAKVQLLTRSGGSLHLDGKAAALIKEIADMVFALQDEQAIRRKVDELLRHLEYSSKTESGGTAAYMKYESRTEGAGYLADQDPLEGTKNQAMAAIWESEKEKDGQLNESQKEHIKRLMEMIREMMGLQAESFDSPWPP